MPRIFLVDDHPVVRAGLRAIVESGGHEVAGESGDATVALAEIARTSPDLVLLDLSLGTGSGLDLLARLQQRGPQVPVIVLTMSEQARDVAQALRSGALGYLHKSVMGRELLTAIAEVGAGRRYLGSGLAERAVDGLTAQASGAGKLSLRERQIVVLVARGASSAEIGEQLHLSPKTVDTYRSRAMAKIGVADMPALVRWAVREGLVGLDE